MPLSSLKIQFLPRFSLNFAANIMASLWMLVGSIKAFDWVKPTFTQFLLFCILALSVNVLFAWLVADANSVFNEQGLISYLVWPMIMLIAGIILAKRSQNYTLLFVPVILWLTADTLLVLLQSGIQFLGNQNLLPAWSYGVIEILFFSLFIWQTVSLLWVFAKRLHWPWWEQVIMLIGAVSLLFVWQKNANNQRIFQTTTPPPTLSEVAFYAQPMLLDDKLANLTQSSEGISDWYFVGVAGYPESVFAGEITEAQRLFDVRFGMKGRSLALVNNPYTWQSEPIASQTSLDRVLKHLGKKMNASEDVLFLVLSSHGAVDESGKILGDIVLDNPPLELEDINPKWLKQTLDNAGIRWRVIVVSSCYSGTFIDELSSPTTVIITASKADRASFGCQPGAELSYFGEAFFAEALRAKTSFESAFKQAIQRIKEREALLGFEPSEPQMVVGSLMKTALPEFEKALFYHDTQETVQAK